MAYETKPNSGSLFKNDRKEKETHPDYKGQALIGGVEMWVSAWIKEGKNGKFMSLSFTEKVSNSPLVQQAEPRRQAIARAAADDDTDCPF